MALPTATFDPTKTLLAKKSIAAFTPAGGSAVNIPGKLSNYDQVLETIRREVPGPDGILRADRIAAVRHTEGIKFETEEIELLESIFGSGKLSGIKGGSVVLYLIDPDDASGEVALKSDAFACVATLDGGLSFGSEFSKAMVNFEALEEITWEIDATV